MENSKNFTKYGISIPKVLLPNSSVDMQAWSVIACDQFTQDRDYWSKVNDLTEGKPSTNHIILPEVYLEDGDKAERLSKIQSTMKKYIDEKVFDDELESFIYVERTTGYGRCRRGLMVAVDLETYDWKPFSKALIRATEATIESRIPPRMEIRRGAMIESPHIMLLVNDPDKIFIEAVGDQIRYDNKAVVYDTDLMMNSGHIKGWAVKSPELLSQIKDALAKIAQANTGKDGDVCLFAVGDGNHSLATAKAVWDEYKKAHPESYNKDDADPEKNHPSRYALVEIVNLFDEGLTFEPIHRVMFDADVSSLIDFAKKELNGETEFVDSERNLSHEVRNSTNKFGFVYTENGNTKYCLLKTGITELAVSKLQPALDKFLKENASVKIDYIHGTEEVFRLGKKNGAVSILLPPVAKDSFFNTIILSGPLPRKSFSMGEASEKRFYLECKRINN